MPTEHAATVRIIGGPPLMDLQEALFFNPSKELYFTVHGVRPQLKVTLNGLLRHDHATETGGRWLLLGRVVEEFIFDRARLYARRQIGISYSPAERRGRLYTTVKTFVNEERASW